jgi:hypothetical protein
VCLVGEQCCDYKPCHRFLDPGRREVLLQAVRRTVKDPFQDAYCLLVEEAIAGAAFYLSRRTR